MKLGYREGLDRGTILDLALSALFQAADEDSATGGPDLLRGIYPVMATITADGFERVADDEIAERFQALIDQLATLHARGTPSSAGDQPDHAGGRRRRR